MSASNRPSFQKATKTSSGSVAASPNGRWNNLSAGVSPVRGLSPVRNTFLGRQNMDPSRSHTNPLFTSRGSDSGRTPTKIVKESKENREKPEPWKVPMEKAQYSGKTLSTTPVKTARPSVASRFTTPPKPVVKRKILAENREFSVTTLKANENVNKAVPAAPPSRKPDETKHVDASSPQKMEEVVQKQAEEGVSADTSAWNPVDSTRPRSPGVSTSVSIEDLQRRIKKFLQAEEIIPVVSAPFSPVQNIDNARRLSGPTSSESAISGLEEEAPYHPIYAPYSARPDFLRARKSLSPTATEDFLRASRSFSPPATERNFPPLCDDESESREETKTTPPTFEMLTATYDPKSNFLSPRPQYLRYRPLRRLELLRKSAEGLLNELDVESTDADSSISSKVESEKEEVDSQEAQSLKSSSDSLHLKTSPKKEIDFQEAQSLKSSSDRLNLKESPKLCKPTHTHFEIFDKNSEELQTELDEIEPPQLELPAPQSEVGDKSEDEEEQVEEYYGEDSESRSSLSFRNRACSVVSLFLLVSLVLIASGSPALLPRSLHENPLSYFWKTSKVTEPARQFIKLTEGLWAVPYSGDSSASVQSTQGVGVSDIHVSNAVVEKTGRALWSALMKYSVLSGKFVSETYANLKTVLKEFSDLYRSKAQEANEWYWVSGYDFVVPHHMFDSAAAYKRTIALMESWGLVNNAGTFTSPIQDKEVSENLESSIHSRNNSMCFISPKVVTNQITSYTRPPAPVVIERTGDTFVPGLQSERLSQSGSPGDDGTADDRIFESEVISAFPVVFEDRQVGSFIVKKVVLSQAQDETQLLHVDEIQLSNIGEDIQLSVVLEETQMLNDVEEIQMSTAAVIDVPVSDPALIEESSNWVGDAEGGSHLSATIENAFPSETTSETETTQEEISNAEEQQEQDLSQTENLLSTGGKDSSSHAGEVNPSQFRVPKTLTNPNTTFLQKLKSTPSIRNAAVGVFMLLLFAGGAVLVFQKRAASAVTDLKLDQDVSGTGGFSTQPTDPILRYDATTSQSSSERKNIWAGYSSDFVERPTPSPVPAYTYERLHDREPYTSFFPSYTTAERRFKHAGDLSRTSDSGIFPSPEKRFKHLSDLAKDPVSTFSSEILYDGVTKTNFLASPERSLKQSNDLAAPNPTAVTPERPLSKVSEGSFTFSPERSSQNLPEFQNPVKEMLDESSLGRFTTLVPVVHNEGTGQQEVTLTPVKRSNRIRARLQSPCNAMHSHHLCNC